MRISNPSTTLTGARMAVALMMPLAAGSLAAQQHREGGGPGGDAEQEQVDGYGPVPHQRGEVKCIMQHDPFLLLLLR